MHFLATLAVLLLPLVGYSLGVVLKSGKAGVRKPIVLDVILVILMWIGILYSRSHVPFSKWIQFAAGVVAGLLLGLAVTAIKGYSEAERQSAVAPIHEKKHSEFKRGKAFREFSSKIGTFQSQILLGLLFLIVFAPVALAVRFFSDPLKIKGPGSGSHWSPKTEIAPDLALFKKQS
ncbi:MAG: hypothetical protein Q8O91_02175 [Candidatus Aminicenantes bacterium]|nr:hypothetical protein [Candidatus Aminicenantes bacterium]